jgi:signal transduction histidine kinase/BarA-like signal transduction histidine kinase
MMLEKRDLILVVDDNDTGRYHKERILARAGYEVIQAADGLEALRIVAERQPRVVVLDVKLPGLDGWEVCRRIKNDPGTSSTLVLQTSATYVRDADTVRALEGGADGCLTEPVEPAVMVATVRALLRIRAAEDLLREALAGEKHARTAAEAAREAVEAANQSKDEFLATLSHELRSPLGTMLSWVSLLRKPPIDPVQLAKGLEVIERNVRLQMKLIDDLLDVSRIVSGKMRLEVGLVELEPVVTSAIVNIRAASDAKHVRIESVVDRTIGPVWGDATRLQQVVWNLLANAIKFTPRGGSVRITVHGGDNGARIEVSDTGKGIAPEVLPKIFERFQQADPTTTRAEGGLGLGLAIVRHIVELHGGTVEASSPGLGGGTTVSVEIPYAEARGIRSQALVFTPEPHLADTPSLVGLRMLVVEDDHDALEAVTAVLERSGAAVEKARSVPEALAHLDAKEYDVLVSDIAMAGMDGITLIQKVRERRGTRGGDVAALALTAYAGAETQRRALEAGYQAYLTKPIDIADLVSAVASLAKAER